jgi:hypothetical protein
VAGDRELLHVLNQPYFPVSKLKGHHFDTVEVIGAELQAVLNTLTENYFQAEFKKL